MFAQQLLEWSDLLAQYWPYLLNFNEMGTIDLYHTLQKTPHSSNYLHNNGNMMSEVIDYLTGQLFSLLKRISPHNGPVMCGGDGLFVVNLS